MKREKKGKIKKRLILNMLLLFLSISTGYFIYSILLLDGIENLLRYLFAALLVIIFIIYFLSSYTLKHKTKFKKALYYITILILIGGLAAGGYYINKVYKTIDNISKDTVTYSTSLVVLTDSGLDKITDIKDLTIGMISDISSIDGYVISKEIIAENNLTKTNEITEYDDFYSIINALYTKEIEAAFLPSEYATMFADIEDFSDIATKTKKIISKTKEVKKKETKTNTKSLTEPFTVLIMGIDAITSDIKNANSNGDSLMVVTFNPETLNSTIFSIPRDTYVPVTCLNNRKSKITHAGAYGEECVEETIEKLTGIEIDYYVKVDFKGVVDLVEILDGISVNVPMNFCEQNSNRSYKNQICLKTGVQTLNGEEALALARHRHSLRTGDLQRGLNQQLVLEGIIKEVKDVKSVNQLYNILSAVEKHLDTNIPTSEILSLYNVAKDIVASGSTNGDSIIAMQQLFLQTSGARIYEASFGKSLSYQLYHQKSLDAVINAMEVNLGIKEAALVKTFSFSVNTVYEKEIIGKGLTGGASIPMVPNFVGKTEAYVRTWGSNNGKSIIVKYTEKDSSFTDGNVLSQSVAAQTDIELISSITIYVAKVVEEEEAPVTYCTDIAGFDSPITAEVYGQLTDEQKKEREYTTCGETTE